MLTIGKAPDSRVYLRPYFLSQALSTCHHPNTYLMPEV